LLLVRPVGPILNRYFILHQLLIFK